MVTKSIRWRLILWIALLLLGILGGFGFSSYRLARSERLGAIDDELRRRVAVMIDDVRRLHGGGPPPRGNAPPMRDAATRRNGSFSDGDRPPPPPDFDDGFERREPPPEPPGRSQSAPRAVELSGAVAHLFDETDPNGFYYAVWYRNGVLTKRSANSPQDVTLPAVFFAGGKVEIATRGNRREAHYFTELGDCVLLGISMVTLGRDMRDYAWQLVLIGAAILAVGAVGGWWLVTLSIRPIATISAAANRISAGNLSERINVEDTDNELGRLASLLNTTFARLEASFAEQKQFTADASHELRTPLTVIMTEAQTALMRARSPEEYREALETCLEAAQQMRRLADSLMELARFDAGQAGQRRSSFDLGETAMACVELVQPLAEQRQIVIRSELEAAPMRGDPDRIRQVITNLLANAIYYNREGGQIRVGTRAEKGAVVLTVADSGGGISSEDLPNIFKRFYRADKARTNPDGRSGLGLSIVKSIIDLHGGKIDVESRLGAGSTFTVKLPVD